MKIAKHYFLMALFAAAVLTGCKDDDEPCCDPTNPECPNYDPCHGGPINKADFTISNQVLTVDGWITLPDTMFGPWFPLIYFDALYPDQVNSHKWYLGTEVIEQAAFVRNFQDATFPSNITVSHVVTYDELDPCKPDDNGRDSVAVTFRLVGSYFEFASIGTFRGSHEGSPEYEWSVYPIKENYDTAYTVHDTWRFMYVNFHNQGIEAHYFQHQPTNGTVAVTGSGSTDPRGIYTVDNEGQIIFDYRHGGPNIPASEWKFRGIKIN